MEDINDLKSSFSVESILLTESNFSRKGNIKFNDSDSEVTFETGVGSKEDIINVKLKTTVINMYNNEEQYKIEVTMVGVFKCNGNPSPEAKDSFGRINCAAIIFPFVREHIANIALKAGLGVIILPPVNFTKINTKENQN